jgi:hypothetical protein
MTPTSSATDNPRAANASNGVLSRADGSLAGVRFVLAIADKDFVQLAAVLHPEIELRALTPRRTWAPESHSDVLEVLRTWFGNCTVERIVRLDSDSFADRHRVAYRFQGDRPDGRFVIEQQAYYGVREGQIDWMRIVCSGFRTP